jgi:hypothetical protein
MKYVYTNLGLHESEKGYSTPERAILEYYKEQKFLINDRIRKSRENIRKNEKELKKLEETFKNVIHMFPEHLI